VRTVKKKIATLEGKVVLLGVNRKGLRRPQSGKTCYLGELHLSTEVERGKGRSHHIEVKKTERENEKVEKKCTALGCPDTLATKEVKTA